MAMRPRTTVGISETTVRMKLTWEEDKTEAPGGIKSHWIKTILYQIT